MVGVDVKIFGCYYGWVICILLVFMVFFIFFYSDVLIVCLVCVNGDLFVVEWYVGFV